jgi:hypothetical protein
MTRRAWQTIEPVFRFFFTGGKALFLGLVFWYLLLAVIVVVFEFDIRRIGRYRPIWFFGTTAFLGLAYAFMFFLGSLLASRSRWSCGPASAAFTAYAFFAMIVMPCPMPQTLDDWIFLSPLLASLAGGLLGERVFRRLHQ